MGALGEAFDWPVPVTMMLSLAAGITVSISGNKLLFKNADGIEIGSKTLSDDDLKIVEQTIEGENYSNLTEVVSAKEAEVYLHFLESGSTEGMTESELKAVQKIEELIKSNKIDYDGILKIRNETVKSDVEVVRKTTEDSVEDVGKSAAEDAGKVVESGSKGGLVPDFYVGPNGKALPSQYKDWIGTNIQKELLEQAENLQLQNAIKQLYRENSFIGDGGTADVIRFEQQTGLMLGKNGGSHVQKGIDMAKYIENKILTQDLSSSDRALAIQLLENLYSALGR